MRGEGNEEKEMVVWVINLIVGNYDDPCRV
jgi:hypothetical protein